MKNTIAWGAAILLALIVLFLVKQCWVTLPVTDCKSTAICPGRPANILERGIILELKNFYTLEDLKGERDTFELWKCPIDTIEGQDSLRVNTPFGSPGGGCVLDTIFFTGEDAFLKALNHVLVGKDEPWKINSISELQFESCKCEEDIFLLTLPQALQNDPDIEHRVASGTTESEEENNGVIGAIGFNSDLSETMDLYATDLAGVGAKEPERCGIIVDYEGYDFSEIETLSEEERSDLMRKVETTRKQQAKEGKCEKPPSISLPVAGRKPQPPELVAVAVIDSGSDPFYQYLNTSSSMESYFHFTSEITNLVINPINLSFDYGMPIPGNQADVNGNCLDNDYYGFDYYGNDNNPSDKNGHGTHVTGIILSAANNVGHPIRVVPLQFGDMNANNEFKGSLFSAICAINYAVERKVDIINMSWGYSSPDTNQVLMQQVKKAYKAGILMVASAGNKEQNVDECKHWPSHFSTFPELADQVISVAASEYVNGSTTPILADYSNFGQSIDLAAPGNNVSAALVHSNDKTVGLSGTSMAAAVISRRAAMLMGTTSGVKLSAAAVKQKILAETISMPQFCIAGGRFYDPGYDPTLWADTEYK